MTTYRTTNKRYFSKNNRSEKNNRTEQLNKIFEEISEIKMAVCEGESDSRIAEECYDAIHAIEGYIDKLNVDTVKIQSYVLLKNMSRGDYDA